MRYVTMVTTSFTDLPCASALKRVFVQNLSHEYKFDSHENKPVGDTFSYEWFRTKTRFDTEAKDNSEMAYHDQGLITHYLLRDCLSDIRIYFSLCYSLANQKKRGKCVTQLKTCV